MKQARIADLPTPPALVIVSYLALKQGFERIGHPLGAAMRDSVLIRNFIQTDPS
ncbi:hypothetical protein [Paracoccus litorisediminis]|uniref:Uncharacterized protein n=1 Tax=Paracoccus litorisediminis TaxID=2006130 RepID=A0A844HNS5_9RHOB|nr:hypothetical protein [Paracoccus litorisediminis]MTH60007.1 hypothetical protein [Paracoccus litorisediminis]